MPTDIQIRPTRSLVLVLLYLPDFVEVHRKQLFVEKTLQCLVVRWRLWPVYRREAESLRHPLWHARRSDSRGDCIDDRCLGCKESSG